MKAILAFLTFALSTPAWATWSLVNANTCNLSCSGTTCAISVTTTGAGNFLGALYIGNTSSTITGISGGGTFTHCTSCSGGTSGTDFTDLGAVFATTGGSGTITVTVTPTASSWTACVSEWHYTGTISSDTQAKNTDSACTTCAGPALTLTGTNDLIIQAAGCTNTCATSATGGFVGATPWINPGQAPGGGGWGAAINQATYTAPNWSQNTSGAVQVSAWAIKETGGAVIPTRGKAVTF